MGAEALDLDDIIDRLLTMDPKGGGITGCMSAEEIMAVCLVARDDFLSQPSLLDIAAPVKVCGDIHGQYADLLRIFNTGFPPSTNFLFLGDYIDRGKQSLEVIVLLLVYKLKYPENFFLLRGNHELMSINRVYGFFDECHRRYYTPHGAGARLYKTFQAVFNCMPFCALIEHKIICMHGGLSPEIRSLDLLRHIERPVCPDGPGMLMDLLWSDPGRQANGWQSSPRGISYLFGADIVNEFCKEMKIDLVARAHEVVADGYEFFAGRHLVTLFSAPNYCGEFDNAAATMTVDENLLCSFEVFRPTRTVVSKRGA